MCSGMVIMYRVTYNELRTQQNYKPTKYIYEFMYIYIYIYSDIYIYIMEKSIITHDSNFHTDEIYAIALLQRLSEFKDWNIIRTRDEKKIEKGGIVVDVGSIYDPKRNRYDHHQREFNETFDSSYNVRLSSLGLIYKHYGEKILKEWIEKNNPLLLNELTNEEFQHIYKYFYRTYI